METPDQAELFFFSKIASLLGEDKKVQKSSFSFVCGADASYDGSIVHAAAVSISRRTGEIVESTRYTGRVTFPYVSGLFYLREGPFVVEVIRRLERKPDLVCFDAHGLAHPRMMGMAAICGRVLGVKSIGIAKSLLAGKVVPYKQGLERILLESKTVGYVAKDSSGRRYFWSPGHAVSIKELEEIMQEYKDRCLEALRAAHELGERRAGGA